MNAPLTPISTMLRKSLEGRNLRLPGLPSMSSSDRRRMWTPIIVGCLVIVALVIGAIIWASVTEIDGAISAPGFVKVENNRKSVRAFSGGVVRQILVREGDQVAAGQVLMRFDDTTAQAQYAVLQNQYDVSVAHLARFEAEMDGKSSMPAPAALKSRMNDPVVARLVSDEQAVFRSRLTIYQTQASVLRQRMNQLSRRVEGINAQLSSQQEQSKLIDDELVGLTSLYERGYAPRTRVLALQRNAASLRGNAGEQRSAAATTEAQIGEAVSQLAELQGQRIGEAAEAVQLAQAKIADVLPRLDAARVALEQTVIRSPAKGSVLNLTQFTEGGVVGAGEELLDVVPSNVMMVVQARIKPQYINSVQPGLPAKIQLAGYSSRTVQKIPGVVHTVSADRTIDPKTGDSYFNVEIRVKPEDVVKAGPKVKLFAGMPATAQIVTGERTIMEYLIGPMRDALAASMKEI